MKHSISWTEIQEIKHRKTVTLRPCPFCGGTPEYKEAGYGTFPSFSVRCRDCKVFTPGKAGPDGQLRATEHWNGRVET